MARVFGRYAAMLQFDPDAYGPLCATLLRRDEVCALGPGTPREACRADLETLNAATLAGSRQVVDHLLARCCIAGLWLLHDFLDESHAISQQIPTSTGSYWHAIMHRREGDFSNAKYWFRRVADHPIFEPLCTGAAALAQGDPRGSRHGLSCPTVAMGSDALHRPL